MADSIASIASTLSIGLYIACCSNEFLSFGIHAQVTARPISVLMGLESRTNFLLASATYRELLALPFDAPLQELQRPDTKAAILSDLDLSQLPTPILSDWENLYRFGADMPYLPGSEMSVANAAARHGVSAESQAYDRLIENGGK